MPEIDFVATDELPAPHHVTVVSVFGSNFTPRSEVNIGIHHGRAVIAHGFRTVGNDGTFQWGSVVSPRLACDTELMAAVHESPENLNITAITTVVCP